jgi:hypothetical protein
MNSYEIKLEYKTDTYKETYNALSFPEAARKAYSLRSGKGLDWKIISVKKINGE